MCKNVLVLLPLNPKSKTHLEEQAKTWIFGYSSSDKISVGEIERANIIIGNPPVKMLSHARKLEWLQLESAGTGDYINPGVLPKGTLLTNATGAYGLAISEHMLGMLFEIYKKLYLYRDYQIDMQWKDAGTVKSVYQSTVLIVGLGDIGGEFARRIHALGGYTIGIRRSGTDKPDYLDELHHLDQLDSLLPRADVVALSLPETPQTHHLFNRERLQMMKPDAVLLNVGRGTAIQTDDLCDVLESGHLLGAGLDVTNPEPLPKDHRLWKIPNVIVTPHVSGGPHLPETYRRILEISAQNLNAFVNHTA